MTNDIETLITALYVKIDDELGGPRLLGRPPALSDSELVCLAVAQALLGFTSEAQWLRYARKHLAGMFPYLPQQSGYNKRLRAGLGLVKRVIRMLARSSDFWLDGCWIADSTPVPCGMSRSTVQRSDLGGWQAMATAPRTRGSFGDCGCIWCAPRPGCRSCGRWPIPSSVNGRCWPPCWRSRRMSWPGMTASC